MAASLKISAELRDTDIGMTRKVSNVAVTTSNDGWDFRKVSVTTSEYTFTIDTGIGDAGLCMLYNADSTNFVQYGFATTVYHQRILGGHVALFQLEPGTAAIYLKADTATCEVEVYVREA